jgi:hypothetical protein
MHFMHYVIYFCRYFTINLIVHFVNTFVLLFMITNSIIIYYHELKTCIKQNFILLCQRFSNKQIIISVYVFQLILIKHTSNSDQLKPN